MKDFSAKARRLKWNKRFYITGFVVEVELVWGYKLIQRSKIKMQNCGVGFADADLYKKIKSKRIFDRINRIKKGLKIEREKY